MYHTVPDNIQKIDEKNYDTGINETRRFFSPES
jgi:hypothetical protein